MCKILFIVPPHITFNHFIKPSYNAQVVQKGCGSYGRVLTDIPLGVLSLSAYLKKHTAVETKLIDFNVILNKVEGFKFNSFSEFFRDFLSAPMLAEYNPTIIGISALFAPAYHSMCNIAEVCRDVFPNAAIIAGGSVPTSMYNETYRDSDCFDALCYGEGEKPLLGLVKAGDKSRYLDENPSWITRRKVENRQPLRPDLIEDLDEIPFYDYGILNVDDYGMNPTISAYLSIDKKRNMPNMTSRGCVFRCCFCSVHTVHGRRMRYYSIKRVREDFKRIRDEYDIQTIIFQDDHFMASKERAYEIFDILHDLRLTAFFPNSLAIYALDRKMLEALKGVGVNQLILAAESGSKRVLKEIMHKPLNLSMVRRVADDCRELGIYTDMNILIGLPGETKQDIEDTRAFLRTVSPNWVRINIATPLVGSEMFEIAMKNNYLKDDYVGGDFKKGVIETADFTAEYIEEMSYIMNLECNFVANSDFRLGNYEVALKGFENAIRAKNDHAIAYYYAAKCYEKLGDSKRSQEYMDTAKTCAEKPFWRKYIDIFNIPLQ